MREQKLSGILEDARPSILTSPNHTMDTLAGAFGWRVRTVAPPNRCLRAERMYTGPPILPESPAQAAEVQGLMFDVDSHCHDEDPKEASMLTARKLLNVRLEIGFFLDPGLFPDPAYTILLGLLAKYEEGGSFSMAECVSLSRVPATTCLRWLALLKERKLVEFVEAESTVESVQLTAECRAVLQTYVQHVGNEVLNE